MSSGAPHRLIEKKGKQLSKFLGIDSVPSTQLIANMQSRINNPIFKLSMTDTALMHQKGEEVFVYYQMISLKK